MHAPSPLSQMGEAALWYARLGLPVFPCNHLRDITGDPERGINPKRRCKIPLIKGGFKNATTDTNQIVTWWRQWPNALIGIPTGSKTNLWVLDPDLKPEEGVDGLTDLANLEAHYTPLPLTVEAKSGRGGRHLYFAWDPTRPIRNSSGKLPDSIDVRGEGGYIIVPPSKREDGLLYTWINPLRTIAQAPAPDWLYDLIRSKPEADPGGGGGGSAGDETEEDTADDEFEDNDGSTPTAMDRRGRAYAKTALDGAAAQLAGTRDGQRRNHKLNAIAYHLGRMVARGWIDRRTVEDRLLAASYTNGHVDDKGLGQTHASLQSGLRKGVKRAHPNLKDRPKDGDKVDVHNRPLPISMHDLQKMRFAPIRFVAQGYITEGVTIFAGKPKIGKSWFFLDVGNAVSTGSTCLGNVQCELGDVIYCALEDNQRRVHDRMTQILGPDDPWPERFKVETLESDFPRLDQGGYEIITNWLDRFPELRLIVLDTFKKVRAARDMKDTLYDSDYASVEKLQKLALERRVAIVIIVHTRKLDAEDPIDSVSGTLGLSGAADTILVIKRDGQGVTLYGRGRDIEEIESAITFDRETCRWTILGDAAEVHRSAQRTVILNALKYTNEPMAPREIADETGLPHGGVRKLLRKMCQDGEVVKSERGKYQWCDPIYRRNKPSAEPGERAPPDPTNPPPPWASGPRRAH